jgi:hypothetical protein
MTHILFLAQFLGNVEFGLVDGLDYNTDKDSTFIKYHSLLTKPLVLGGVPESKCQDQIDLLLLFVFVTGKLILSFLHYFRFLRNRKLP